MVECCTPACYMSILSQASHGLLMVSKWCLLPTTPPMLPTATKHFDRATSVCYIFWIGWRGGGRGGYSSGCRE